MPAQPHVIVVGLGIAGSSIAATLAERGLRVTGIEQFEPLHERGSSHGDTRIFRCVPHEGEVYVGMAATSYEGWLSWNRMAGEKLFIECGGIDAGPEQSAMVQAAEDLCRSHDRPFEVMTGRAFNVRHPRFRLPAGWRVVFQSRSGVLRPDATRAFLHKSARRFGARLMHKTAVSTIDAKGDGVKVLTEDETLTADYLIVAAGSWLPELLPEIELPLAVERRVLAWFQPEAAEDLTDGRMPIFVLDADGGWYGMPTPDGMVKIGHDKHLRQQIDPRAFPIPAGEEDEAFLTRCAEKYLVGFSNSPKAMRPCLYTLTPDHHFLIDRHPAHDNILLFSCCSGHGFKYAPAYGAIAADLIQGQLRDDLAGLRLGRAVPAATRFGA